MSQQGTSRRKKSLRIPLERAQAPIPPSLLQSPHLNSPQSVFNRRPSRANDNNADEEWLQDTVPQHGAVKPQESKEHGSDLSLSGRGGRPPLLLHKSDPGPRMPRSSPAIEHDGYFVGL
ncbi:hypothetical protein FB45DRAFT_1026589 [Roridomyces roridus]|uniref:Uncharacterized protein n=1 Tax=Roridomyces roridus TaxID=1738132 RepID=A0AAD7BWE6_9AGAR|nr:hypothetical protein FB45DRAFT_1026589 [Roridomyces roridus]